MWCIQKIDKEYEQRMMDVLEVYERPYDPEKPVVCFDEKSVALRAETRQSMPMKPGQVKRRDYEYKRNGTANIFVFVEPKGAYRSVTITKRRTKKDWANEMKRIADVIYPHAEKIVVVLDNLNIHFSSSFYEAFSLQEAQRLMNRFEFHYTPKHASWLNMAEIEIGALTTQCLKQPMNDFQHLQKELFACVRRRNKQECRIKWQFTRKKAQQTMKLNIIKN